jgi:hypothetical protein
VCSKAQPTPPFQPVNSTSPYDPLNKPVRRVTREVYGSGRKARRLVVALEPGDLITLREHGRRVRLTARLHDVFWWMLRTAADKARMEKLTSRKARKAGKNQGAKP